jgi:hypothetical protein
MNLTPEVIPTLKEGSSVTLDGQKFLVTYDSHFDELHISFAEVHDADDTYGIATTSELTYIRKPTDLDQGIGNAMWTIPQITEALKTGKYYVGYEQKGKITC